MLRRIIQFFKRLIQRLFGKQPTSPSPVPETLPTRTDTEYEALFLQLLDTVQQGTSRGQVKGWLIGNKVQEAELVAWLQRFGNRLLQTPSQHEELAGRMLALASLDIGELGDVSGRIGRSILEQIAPQTEAETSENREVYPIIEAEFFGDGVTVSSGVNASENVQVDPMIEAEFVGDGVNALMEEAEPALAENSVLIFKLKFL